jgi:hypothetical protein
MERQAGGVGVSHRGGLGASTPVAIAGTRADSPVSSALPVVAVQLRCRPGRGRTVPRTGAAVGPTDHLGGGCRIGRAEVTYHIALRTRRRATCCLKSS